MGSYYWLQVIRGHITRLRCIQPKVIKPPNISINFRSPFGDPDISLSPIPKSKLFTQDENSERVGDKDAVRNLKFETTSNFGDSDLDETAHDAPGKSNHVSPLT